MYSVMDGQWPSDFSLSFPLTLTLILIPTASRTQFQSLIIYCLLKMYMLDTGPSPPPWRKQTLHKP